MTRQILPAPSDRSADTRNRILDAALREFALHGLAGARTERIAAAAAVNKALLYYYFESKEKLYIEVLETIAGRVRESSLAVFDLNASPGERIVRAALNHFDRIVGQQEFQSLMQQEMIRLHKNESGAMPVLVQKVFEPVIRVFSSTMREGIATGELINVDWMQILLAALGANVFYFLSAPMWRLILPEEPLTLDALRLRRKSLVDFLGQAIFQDRQRGAEIAARVFADTPMPAISGDRLQARRSL